MKKKILIIDDDPDLCILLSMFLTRNGFITVTAPTAREGIAKCRLSTFDAVFCDYHLPDKTGAQVLTELKKIDPSIIVLIITGQSDVKTAVEVIKSGALDYLSKPLQPEEILDTLDRGFAGTGSSRGNFPAVNRQNHFVLPDGHAVIAYSPLSKELYRQVRLVAKTGSNLIVYGESGSGKEIIARTIHNYSNRAQNPFVAINGTEVSGELQYAGEPGADGKNPLENAKDGTLFIYGVGELSLDEQRELFNQIRQEKWQSPDLNKGEEHYIRVIASTGENLESACHRGVFIHELYHLLNEYAINIPPLRKRREDILPFADYFLTRANAESGKMIEGFEDEVIDKFYHYDWPGNLRELRNVIRRAVLLTQKSKITIDMLPEEWGTPHIGNGLKQPHEKVEEKVLQEIFRLKRMKAEAEFRVISEVLKRVNQNKTKAAEILKVDRKTLYNKIKAYHDII